MIGRGIARGQRRIGKRPSAAQSMEGQRLGSASAWSHLYTLAPFALQRLQT